MLYTGHDPQTSRRVADRLETAAEAISVECVSSEAARLDRLAEPRVDCVVTDHGAGLDGVAVLRQVRTANPTLPVFVFTADGSEQLAGEAIAAGATGYVPRDGTDEQYRLLAGRIERAVSEGGDETPRGRREQHLSTLVSNLPGMVYRCRNERGWPMTFVSEGAEALTGYDAAAIERGAVDWGSEIIHPEDREEMWDAVQSAIDADEPFEVTYRIETADGETRWMWERGQLLAGDDETEILEGFVTDVTARKERERALRQYKTLTESVADPLYVMTPDGTIEMVNEALADHIGHERAEIVGSSPEQFVVGDGVERAEESIGELLTTDREVATFEMRTVADDGEVTHNETKIAVMTDEDGNFEGTAGVVRDITEREERARELERYETILQAVGDPVYTLDDEGHLTVVNDAMEALSGYDREELVGEHIGTLMTDADVAAGEDLIAELLADEKRTNGTFEMVLITADGREIPCENHVALLSSDDDQFRGTAGVIRDITGRKQRERQLEQFASVVSHDLRSPLNVVQGRIEHVLATGEDEHLADAADAARRMETLIEDLLALAHEGQRVGELEPTALDVAATDAWSHLDAGETTLVVETDHQVEADFDRLCELFDNLFRNAVEHGDADTVRVVDTDGGFAVVDDGPGIPAERRDSVFDRGFTTSEDGTGFGLAIVSEIVDAHGWSIDVEESATGGARFEVRT